jgi:LuxR family maltose regulon positive regulatory protein
MPHFHRSSRDFSEFVYDLDSSITLAEKTIGAVIGSEFIIIKDCLYAGFLYEKGSLTDAYKYAVSANANMQDHFSAELKFCAKAILASIYAAQGQMADNRKILEGIAETIEREKAYYLNDNFEALKCRLKLADGDINAAKDWLIKYPDAPSERITFYKLYCHLTTARALICIHEYNTAMLLLHRVLTLCEEYRRPIDTIETEILLAITYWKKGRGYQQDATEHLEKAIVIAQTYGYTSVFAREGAELTNMLQKIQLRIQKSSYDSPLQNVFVRTLYLDALAESKRFKGLTGGRMPENLKFTKQQMRVMKHLCDGCNYREIAENMGLKYTGVKSHMQLICKKLDVPDSVNAVLKIKETGLLDEYRTGSAFELASR